MDNTTLFIGFVLGVLALRAGMAYSKRARLKQSWRRANEAMKSADFAGAEKALGRCVSLMPLWVPARMLLGAVQAKLGKLTEAEEQLKMAAELQPREAEGHLQLGMFYAVFCPDRVDDAIDAFGAAVECRPELKQHLAREPRLLKLKEDQRFRELVE